MEDRLYNDGVRKELNIFPYTTSCGLVKATGDKKFSEQITIESRRQHLPTLRLVKEVWGDLESDGSTGSRHSSMGQNLDRKEEEYDTLNKWLGTRILFLK